MKLKATFYRVYWLDRYGNKHCSRILGSRSDITRAASETAMEITSIRRIRDKAEIQEMSFRSLATM